MRIALIEDNESLARGIENALQDQKNGSKKKFFGFFKLDRKNYVQKTKHITLTSLPIFKFSI